MAGRRLRRRRWGAALLIAAGFLVTAAVAGVIIWTLASQKRWTDFKVYFARDLSYAVDQNCLRAETAGDVWRLRSENGDYLDGYLTGAEFLLVSREESGEGSSELSFGDGAEMLLSERADGGVRLRYTSPEGKVYSYDLGDSAKWELLEQLVTTGYNYKNTSW